MSYIFFPDPTPVFPTLPSLGYSVHKKPISSSTVTVSASGKAVHLARAAFPRWAFTLTYDWLRDKTQNSVPDPTMNNFTEFTQITSLFIACLGAYGEFYFTDPDDSSRAGQYLGSGNGIQTSYPIQYIWGNGPFLPAITIPVGGINTIDAVYFDGVVQSSSLYTLDSTRTALVFLSPPSPGVSITIDYHFYFRCRFLEDKIDFEQFAKNRWLLKELRFESVKP